MAIVRLNIVANYLLVITRYRLAIWTCLQPIGTSSKLFAYLSSSLSGNSSLLSNSNLETANLDDFPGQISFDFQHFDELSPNAH